MGEFRETEGCGWQMEVCRGFRGEGESSGERGSEDGCRGGGRCKADSANGVP